MKMADLEHQSSFLLQHPVPTGLILPKQAIFFLWKVKVLSTSRKSSEVIGSPRES